MGLSAGGREAYTRCTYKFNEKKIKHSLFAILISKRNVIFDSKPNNSYF